MDRRTPPEDWEPGTPGQPPGTPGQPPGTPPPTREERPGGETEPESRTSEGREEAREVAQSARETAGEVRAETRDYLTRVAEERKAQTADIMDRVARAVKRTADSLEEEDAPSLGRYTEEAAHSIERASGYLRQHDVGSMLSSTEDFARRRPEVFFGGLAVAGLAAGRFLRSSSRSGSSRRGPEDASRSREHFRGGRQDPFPGSLQDPSRGGGPADPSHVGREEEHPRHTPGMHERPGGHHEQI